ncbi:MAG TPA: hypothetical protein VFA07_13195 [Chthonomonadaceae bacterium]|nr:hypothetical protein [Chthonomonadaceae bacterium]
MRIPTQYLGFLGLWQGEVTFDSTLKKPYPGVIGLNADGGDTIYQMKQYRTTGLTKGKLTNPHEKDGYVVLDECLYEGATSWGSGTLSLKLIGEDRLECKWCGAKGNAKAVMTRIKSADPKSD